MFKINVVKLHFNFVLNWDSRSYILIYTVSPNISLVIIIMEMTLSNV